MCSFNRYFCLDTEVEEMPKIIAMLVLLILSFISQQRCTSYSVRVGIFFNSLSVKLSNMELIASSISFHCTASIYLGAVIKLLSTLSFLTNCLDNVLSRSCRRWLSVIS